MPNSIATNSRKHSEGETSLKQMQHKQTNIKKEEELSDNPRFDFDLMSPFELDIDNKVLNTQESDEKMPTLPMAEE